MALAVLLLSAACRPQLGPRDELPTAVAGVVSRDTVPTTPLPGRSRAEAGPTSTPAPWATPIPPTWPAPAKIMHSTAGKADCLTCHRSGQFAVPPDHLRRKNETCLGCHSVNYDAVLIAAPMKHEVAGHEACLSCHTLATAGARPMPGEHTGRPEGTCLNCHKPG